VLIGATLLVQPAPAIADDAETIAACLKSETEAGRNGYDCIGSIAKSCMNAPGGDTTAGMVQCSDRETKVWDAMLNTEYKALVGKLDSAGTDKLRDAQRAWITMRDGDCSVYSQIFTNGSMARVVASGCMSDRRATRALQLRDLREAHDFD
jgi:uncharacterized protein YecT (DUF1311 family)